jgi:hypothetical protein
MTYRSPQESGQGSATVTAVSSQGESETLTLSETAPGRFANAVMERTAGSPILFTFHHLDRTPGGNRPPALC